MEKNKVVITFEEALQKSFVLNDLQKFDLVLLKDKPRDRFEQRLFVEHWLELKFSNDYYIFSESCKNNSEYTLFCFFSRDKKECYGVIGKITPFVATFDALKYVDMNTLCTCGQLKANIVKLFSTKNATFSGEVSRDICCQMERKIGEKYVFKDNITYLFYIFQKAYELTVYVGYNNSTGDPYIIEDRCYGSGHAWLSDMNGRLITWDQVAYLARRYEKTKYKCINNDNWREYVQLTEYDIRRDYSLLKRVWTIDFASRLRTNYGAYISFDESDGKQAPYPFTPKEFDEYLLRLEN